MPYLPRLALLSLCAMLVLAPAFAAPAASAALPVVTITSSTVPVRPPNADPALHSTNATSTTVTFEMDGPWQAMCSVQGEVPVAESPCTSPYTLSLGTNTTNAGGIATFEVYATRGNLDRGQGAKAEWAIDRTPPFLRIDFRGMGRATGDVKANPIIAQITSDATGAVPVCTFDGRPVAPCSLSTPGNVLPLVARGLRTFVAVVTNAKGNVGTISKTVDVLAGPDRLPTVGPDRLLGGAFHDTFPGLAGNDVMVGGAGRDQLEGDAGNDTIDGGADIDELDGGAGNDRLTGGLLQDQINGGPGADVLNGDAGNDQLKGQLGRDTFNGGAGDDTIISFDRGVPEVVTCGTGHDIVWADRNDTVRGCVLAGEGVSRPDEVYYRLPTRTTTTSPLS